jgi:hypothetical protein
MTIGGTNHPRRHTALIGVNPLRAIISYRKRKIENLPGNADRSYAMSVVKRAEQVARDSILKLLSDEENAQVSTAEAASRLTEGAEYLDLEHLDQGVQRAKASTAKARMGHVLPRSAVSEETWRKILAQLAGEARVDGTLSLARVQETVGAAVRRLSHDRGFVIHFAAYLAVNVLLIAINLATTPGKYWFYWPLLGWGLGIAGHAFGVLRHSKRSLR